MTDDLHPWAESLASLHAEVWQRLGRGVADPRAPARHPTLGTIDAEGRPQMRTVVLRAAEAGAARLRIYTDSASAKVAELRATPFASLHIWEPRARLQMRLSARVDMLRGDTVRAMWDSMPEHSRLSYGCTPPPGTPIDTALAYTKAPDPAAFVVLELQLDEIEALHLGPVHRRARFLRAQGWQGQWLSP